MLRSHKPVAFCCALALAACFTLVMSAARADITMPPYLQAVSTDGVWVLIECNSTGVVTVQYGLTTTYGSTATTSSYLATTGSTYVHRVRLTGLQPNTTYHYRASQGATTSVDAAFKTAVQAGTSFRFAFMSDFQSTATTQDAMVARLLSQHNPQFSVYGGDMAYTGSTYSNWKDHFFNKQKALVAKVPFFGCVGNHDGWSTNPKAFLQAPGSASGTQEYYSFDYGDAHFLILNNNVSYTSSSAQYAFARADLAASSKTWKIVAFHKSAYCAGGHGEDADMKTMATNVFQPYGVDLVLTGHNHFYQHNLVNGIHHMVLGPAHDSLRDPGSASYTIKSVKDSNYGVIDVTPATLTLNVFGDDGTSLDTVQLTAGTTVSFTAASQSKAENAGTVTITARLSQTSSTAVTVPFTVTGTASGGSDYSITASPITISAGNTSGTATITITDDIADEPDETAIVTMGTPTNATKGATTVHTLTITDDDGGGTVDIRVGASSDDAEETVSTGAVNLTSTDLELVVDSSAQAIGLRFASVAIPHGATITQAYIQFKTDEVVNANPTSLTIAGEAADSAATFTTASKNISSRGRTAATVIWSPPDWTVAGEVGANQRTPELKAVVQEIVNRSGWAAGNSLAVIVTGVSTSKRVAEAYDKGAGGAPVLHVVYDVPLTNQPPQILSQPWANPNPVTLPDTTTLSVMATDDGLPNPPAKLTYTWSKVSGAGTVTFAANNGTDTGDDCVAGFSTAGTYLIKVTVSDGALTASGQVSVTVNYPSGPGTGITREWWTGITGSSVSNLTGNPAYPNTPTGTQTVTAYFEAPTNWADNYGTRMHGYFIPPVTGSYTFYIASDDSSELWLSTSSDPAGAVKIASVTGYTSSRAWTKYASQKSAAIPLTGGSRYYIRALQKEGGGSDNLAVGVDLPGGISEKPIPGHRLDPWTGSITPVLASGLKAEFFDYTTALSTLPDLAGKTADVTRVDTQVYYPSTSSTWANLDSRFADYFASRHSGYLKVDTAADYTLYLNSDDGSKLWIDGALLIDNDGLHGMREKTAVRNLTAGYHVVRIEYFENSGGAGLSFSWSSASISKQIVPASALYRDAPTGVNVAPSVSLTSPASGATSTAPASFSLKAIANDADGTISKVEFYQGTTLVNTDPSSPYSYTWSGVLAGAYTLTAKAYDNSGAVTTSSAISVTVSPNYTAGLKAEFFDYTSALSTIPDLTGKTADITRVDAQIYYPSTSGTWANLDSRFSDTYASRHTGYLNVAAAGDYTLYLNSDDGSRLYLDGVLVINNDGLHGMTEKSMVKNLSAGYHTVKVEFFENGGGAGLSFSWAGPGINKQIIPAGVLYYDAAASPE